MTGINTGMRFSHRELMPVTYMASYGYEAFGGYEGFARMVGRTPEAIVAKVLNAIHMLDKHGFPRTTVFGKAPTFNGRNKNDDSRNTDWDIVEAYARLDRVDLLDLCRLRYPGLA